MIEEVYYNVWNIYEGRWTDARAKGYTYQDPKNPEKLTLEEANALYRRILRSGFEVRPLLTKIYLDQKCSGCMKIAPHLPPNTMTGTFLCSSCKILDEL